MQSIPLIHKEDTSCIDDISGDVLNLQLFHDSSSNTVKKSNKIKESCTLKKTISTPKRQQKQSIILKSK